MINLLFRMVDICGLERFEGVGLEEEEYRDVREEEIEVLGDRREVIRFGLGG